MDDNFTLLPNVLIASGNFTSSVMACQKSEYNKIVFISL